MKIAVNSASYPGSRAILILLADHTVFVVTSSFLLDAIFS